MVCEEPNNPTVPRKRQKYCMKKIGARKAGANAALKIRTQLYAKSRTRNLIARTRMNQNETRCKCSAPAVMWECEYFCSLTGSLCNNCTGRATILLGSRK